MTTAAHASRRASQSADRTAEGVEAELSGPAEALNSQPVPVAGLARTPDAAPASAESAADPLGGQQVAPDIVSVLRGRAGRGSALPAQLAEPLGAALDTDLSSVRVHADGEADALARSVQARAFTFGSDVYFSKDAYAPQSEAGQHLIAHELSHVAQQAHGEHSAPHGSTLIGRADDPAERAADASAADAVRSLRRVSAQPVPGVPAASGGAVRRSADFTELTVRRMKIKGEQIRPYGKSGKELWTWVQKELYSTYGTRTIFLQNFCKSDDVYDSRAEFLVDFKKTLEKEGKLRTLETGLGRPAWPETYKGLLNFQAGDNIRHIIRNATLKTALLDDYADYKDILYSWADDSGMDTEDNDHGAKVESELRKHYAGMAKRLGVEVEKDGSSEKMVKKIYEALYLNLENLYAGVGGDNQLIGFAADPVEAFGHDLKALGAKAVSIDEVYGKVWSLVQTSYSKVKSRAAKSGTLKDLDELMGVIKALIDGRAREWKKNAGGPTASATELAEDPLDFGTNFGFDLIISRFGATGAKGEEIAERQGRLLEVETRLRGEVLPGTDDLTKIFELFMKATG